MLRTRKNRHQIGIWVNESKKKKIHKNKTHVDFRRGEKLSDISLAMQFYVRLINEVSRIVQGISNFVCAGKIRFADYEH